jgi:SpoVK/Ycf46/Vps4 family AAA+-type ATPase
MASDLYVQQLTTELSWDDLVLPKDTLDKVHEIEMWINRCNSLFQNWEKGNKVKPGFKSFFFGPNGTGKTLAATLLGKYTGREVFKIDLSLIISKYIGETEKNLGALFEKARSQDWILFFDEADALFGKRISIKDARDRYANQEVSYLLQRIEECEGLVILSSNFKGDIEEAYLRRFDLTIYFPESKTDEKSLIPDSQ